MEKDEQTTEFIREKIPKQSEVKIVINDKVESENNSLSSPPDGNNYNIQNNFLIQLRNCSLIQLIYLFYCLF